MVKNLPSLRETWVQPLGWEDLLEEGMATHSSILAWRIPWTEEPGGLQSAGSQRVRCNWVTRHCMASRIPAECAEYGSCFCLLQDLAQQGAAESPWNGAQLPKDKVWLEPELNWQWGCLDATPKTKQQHFPRTATILVPGLEQFWEHSSLSGPESGLENYEDTEWCRSFYFWIWHLSRAMVYYLVPAFRQL